MNYENLSLTKVAKNNYITLVVIFLQFWRLKNISLCRKIFGDITWKTTVHMCCMIQEKTDGYTYLDLSTGSTPTVGSSRMSSSGFWSRAAPRDTLRR